MENFIHVFWLTFVHVSIGNLCRSGVPSGVAITLYTFVDLHYTPAKSPKLLLVV